MTKESTVVEPLLHLEVIHRVRELPMVETALNTSSKTYSKLKDFHWLLNWALTVAENSIGSATKQAVPIVAPIAKKLENPIHFVDHTLCLGLDKIEQTVPLVKEKPEQILENAYMRALRTVESALSSFSHVNEMVVAQATNLRDLSWTKANQILETHFGSAAVKSLDSTAVVVDKLIDAYFPAVEEEHVIDSTTDITEGDKLLRIMQTFGRLSNKTARRVYVNVIHRARTLDKAGIKTYASFIVDFLHLTSCMQAINEKVAARASPAKIPVEKTEVTDTAKMSSKNKVSKEKFTGENSQKSSNEVSS